MIELARARLITESGDARTARLNPPRLIAFADGPNKATWAADLRQRAVIPKHRLLAQPGLVQPIGDEHRRKQFRLRLGQRYWRDPVPTELVESLQRPLVGVIGRSATRSVFAERFVALLGIRPTSGQVIVVAVRAPGSDEQAEKDWRELSALLEEHEPAAAALIGPEESGVYGVDDVSLGFWLDSFKFDLDEITYGKKASVEQADPLKLRPSRPACSIS